MNEFIFENQGTNTYLVYAISQEDVVDTMSLGMLTNNKISGLAATLFMQVNTTKYIKYNISAKVSVRQFFLGAVNQKRLLGVFKGIVNALLSAEDYMIDVDSILLDLDYIFVDVSTCETALICLPIQGASQQDIGAFFKGIMFSTQFDQSENCNYVATIINYLNSTPLFSLSDFKDLLEKIEQSSVVVPMAVSAQSVVVKPEEKPSVQPKRETVQPVVVNNSVVGQVPNVSASVQSSVTNTVNVNQPKVSVVGKEVVPPSGTENTKTKKSMFGFWGHQGKEKADQKSNKVDKKTEAVSEKQNSKKQKVKGFAVPETSSSNPGFAVPGQETPIIAKQTIQQPVQQPKVTPVTQPQPQTPGMPAQQQTFVTHQAPQGQKANFGETTVLGAGMIGETTVLTAAQNPTQMINPHLVRSKKNEKIYLNKPVFRIGKERSYVDYFVDDNTAISRSHADFITREGEYFVVDTNSTNHTFVNGVMIPSNEETKISHQDVIRLANEDFEFKLY